MKSRPAYYARVCIVREILRYLLMQCTEWILWLFFYRFFVFGVNWTWQLLVCLPTEEELKRLNEALADDSYSAVGFDYNGSDKTTEESSTTETSHGKSSLSS